MILQPVAESGRLRRVFGVEAGEDQFAFLDEEDRAVGVSPPEERGVRVAAARGG